MQPTPPESAHSTSEKHLSDLLFEGLPFKGDVPSLKESDPDYLRPKLQETVHIKVFDTAVPEDMCAMEKVMQETRTIPPTVRIYERDKQFIEITGSWRIFMTWTELYYAMPDKTGNKT